MRLARFLEALPNRLALLVVPLVALALPGEAWGHATLLRTVPADGSVLASPPATVQVFFDDTVRTSSGIKAVRNGGGSVLGGKPRAVGHRLVIPLQPGLPDGDYTVLWRVLSDDGHTLAGVMAFGVGSGRAPPVPSLTADNGPSVQDVARPLSLLRGLADGGRRGFLPFRRRACAGPVVARSFPGRLHRSIRRRPRRLDFDSLRQRHGRRGGGRRSGGDACRNCAGLPPARAAGVRRRTCAVAGADARRPCARSRQAGVRAVRRLPARGCGVVLARRARRARARALFLRRSCAARAAFLERRVRLRPRPRCHGSSARIRRAALGRPALVDRIRPASDREDGSARTARGDRLGEPLPARAPVVVRWSAPQCRGRADVVCGARCRGCVAHRSTAGARPGRRRSRDGGEGTTAASGASHDRAGPRERRSRHRACSRLAGRGARCPGPGRRCGQRAPGPPRRRRGSILRQRMLRGVSDTGSSGQGLRRRTCDHVPGAGEATIRGRARRPCDRAPFAGCEASNTSSASPRARATGSSRTSRSSGRTG